MENVTTLAHRCDQRKTLREEDDFAVPVYDNDSSTRFQSPGRRTKSEKRTTLFRDQAKGSSSSSKRHGMDLEKSASGCERVNASFLLRQESTSSRLELDQDGDETGVVMETDDGVESHGDPNDVDDDDDVSDDSISSVDVSPDEVVGVIGQKRFWRARKAIAK